jgi:hypothetical protein
MESPPELIRKSSGKLFDQPLSINGSCLSPLFLLDDQPADLPIAGHHLGIDDLQSTASSLNEDFPDLLVNALGSRLRVVFGHWGITFYIVI